MLLVSGVKREYRTGQLEYKPHHQRSKCLAPKIQ